MKILFYFHIINTGNYIFCFNLHYYGSLICLLIPCCAVLRAAVNS